MTTYDAAILDPPSLDFNFFKSQEIKNINAKSSQNANEMYNLMIFCYFVKKIISKKLIFGQTHMEFDGCYGNVKNERQNWYFKISAKDEWQLLKVSALWNNLMGGGL